VPATIRRARRDDIPALSRIEDAAFAVDRISPRSFREFVEKRSARLLVAERDGLVVGYALVLYRAGTAVARLYSLAVDPALGGSGIGRCLVEAAAEDARGRGALFLRLEVRPDNAAAIRLYERLGFRAFGRYLDYYEDHSAALRLEKSLVGKHMPAGREVTYYAQTTEFTCGPAAMAMAMRALDPATALGRPLELTLWREATTIFMTSGHGGCEPVGMAVALRKRGFRTSVWVNQPPPFFLDGVRTADKREVMLIVQETFAAEATALGVPIHDRPLARDDLVAAIDGGYCAIVLISPWRMYHERYPHWILLYGYDARTVFAHDPWIEPDEHETAIAKAHLAIPWSEFEAMSAYGRSRLRAAVLVGKGDLT
jgi:ribosomal protein S18 acetylase RimI-like enzyme